jgi:hypothetical protein
MKFILIQFFRVHPNALVTTKSYYLCVGNKTSSVAMNDAVAWATAHDLYAKDSWAFCVLPTNKKSFSDEEKFIGERVLLEC